MSSKLPEPKKEDVKDHHRRCMEILKIYPESLKLHDTMVYLWEIKNGLTYLDPYKLGSSHAENLIQDIEGKLGLKRQTK